MTASIPSTSASSDSTPNPKAQFQEVIDSLECLREVVFDRNNTVKWGESYYKVLQAQLNRLKSDGMKERVSIDNMKTLEKILRHMGRDWPPHQFTTQSDERARCCMGYVREVGDKKSMLEQWADELVEQMNSFLFHPQTQTWKPMTPAGYVDGISRALSSILKFDPCYLWARDKEEDLEFLKKRIEELKIENISHHGNEAGMLKEFYQILRGTGNHEFLEVHDPSERKKEIVRPNFDKLMKFIVDLERTIQGRP